MKNNFLNPLPKTEALPGAVCAQYRRCGKKNCRCADSEPHGPYYFRFWRQGGKLRKQYVPRSQVEAIRAACERSRQSKQRWRTLRDESSGVFRELRDLLKAMGV